MIHKKEVALNYVRQPLGVGRNVAIGVRRHHGYIKTHISLYTLTLHGIANTITNNQQFAIDNNLPNIRIVC